MITPAAWSNQASGTSVRRLSGGVMLAVLAAPAARTPPEQANPVTPKAVGGYDDREWFEWGCSWGATQQNLRFAVWRGSDAQHLLHCLPTLVL